LALILSLSSLGIGYELGSFTTARSRSRAQTSTPTQVQPLPEKVELEETKTEEKDEESAEDIPDGDLAAVSAGFLEPCKMV
jgi:PTH2 family peptidyl-tRNA hydrolase